MSKTAVTVFLCTGKDCTRAWRRVCDGSPGKWLKHQAEEAGLPYKLNVVKTECMDRCDEAACVCFVHGRAADVETNIRSGQAADRLLAAMRACCENADQALGSKPACGVRPSGEPGGAPARSPH